VRHASFLLIINLGAFLVYHTSILLLLEQKKSHDLAHNNYLLTLQNIQYDNLQQRINETRQARHDLRHHAHLILEYLRAEKFRELEAYLARYTTSLPDAQATTYCQHYATNALLGYFVTQAKALGIETDVFLQLPETLHLPETTLSVVLGNLLENAIEACQEVSGPKKITVRGKADLGAVFFEVTNPYNGKINRGKNGQLLSTKEDGRGLGLASVKQIAQSFGGLLELEPRGDVFRASILLPEQPADPQ
jgi:sensor histidine kinase regulating citrate/malate metabolism